MGLNFGKYIRSSCTLFPSWAFMLLVRVIYTRSYICHSARRFERMIIVMDSEKQHTKQYLYNTCTKLNNKRDKVKVSRNFGNKCPGMEVDRLPACSTLSWFRDRGMACGTIIHIYTCECPYQSKSFLLSSVILNKNSGPLKDHNSTERKGSTQKKVIRTETQ